METMRGHDLARIITEGPAIPNTGVPGMVGGVSKERVIHSPGTGRIHNMVHIADIVEKGQILAYVGETSVEASITGVLRGIIKELSLIHICIRCKKYKEGEAYDWKECSKSRRL